MQRREFLNKAGRAGLGALAAGGLLAGCKGEDKAAPATAAPAATATIEWKMVTAWPKNFPGLGTGAEFLARTIGEMSGGRLKVKVFGAGEIVPALEVFDAVSRGTAELGHGASYYWRGVSEAAQFFTTVPFGLTAQEQNAWLFNGGGMELWQETYTDLGVIPMPAGNTGAQMGGWFNREINSVDDLKGLKIRIPGLGGEVIRRAGGLPVNLPGGELFTSLQSGVVDAVEWVGPYNDLALGLYKAAKYYYAPSWQDPCGTIECLINRKAFETLPEDLQFILINACRVANEAILSEYIARNNEALHTLVTRHNVEVRRYPDEVLTHLRTLSRDVVDEVVARNPQAAKIHASYDAFRSQVVAWHAISELAYMNGRGGA
ncbi:MAG: TRAP transporter substrate-binding protein DctP [Ectothiorhodospiraceae bacterium]|nr:TRAP transporter substrate-binding protein DctP [Ectothiorhodospiraceae bacterium]